MRSRPTGPPPPPPPPPKRQAVRDHIQPTSIVGNNRQVQIPYKEICRNPGPAPGTPWLRRSPRLPNTPALGHAVRPWPIEWSATPAGAKREGRGARDGETTATGKSVARSEWVVTKQRQRKKHQTWVPTQSVPNVATRCSEMVFDSLNCKELPTSDPRDPPLHGQVGLVGTLRTHKTTVSQTGAIAPVDGETNAVRHRVGDVRKTLADCVQTISPTAPVNCRSCTDSTSQPEAPLMQRQTPHLQRIGGWGHGQKRATKHCRIWAEGRQTRKW